MTDERHIRMLEWLPADQAPVGKMLLVCGGCPIRIAIRDELGNWRMRWGGPYRVPPKFYAYLPDPPEDMSHVKQSPAG